MDRPAAQRPAAAVEQPPSLRESGQVDVASDVLPVRFEADEWVSGLAVQWCSTLLLLEGLGISGVIVPGGTSFRQPGRSAGTRLRADSDSGGSSPSVGYGGEDADDDNDDVVEYPPLIGLRFRLQHAGVMLGAGTGEALVRLAKRWATVPLQVLRRVQ